MLGASSAAFPVTSVVICFVKRGNGTWAGALTYAGIVSGGLTCSATTLTTHSTGIDTPR